MGLSEQFAKQNFILAVSSTLTSHDAADGLEDLGSEEDSEEAGGLVVKLFHRSSPVNKLLLGSCVLSRQEAVSFIAPTTLWLSLRRSEFDRRSGQSSRRGAIMAEIQLCLQFMAQEDNDVGKKEELLRLHLQREWILSQPLLDKATLEDDDATLASWARHDGSDKSTPSNPPADDADLTTLDLSVSEYADGGYVFPRGGAAASDDANAAALGLSGSGESWSEDSHHYVHHKAQPMRVKPLSRPGQHPPAPPGRLDLGDFNARFQDVTDRMGSSQEAGSSLADRLTLNINLTDLSTDFLYNASSFGRIIISEYNVPPHSKTIKPIGIGGILGGPKYIVRNILFKVCIPPLFPHCFFPLSLSPLVCHR